MTAWEWAAVALWSMKNGTQPRGNTSSGKSHEAAWERGTPTPDNGAKTLTGTRPASWRHDGTHEGIADLNGNVWEWNDGLRLVDGRFYYPVDNDFTLPEASWTASLIYLDSSVGPGDRNGAAQAGVPSISDRITKYSETPNSAGGADTGDYDYTYVASWNSVAVSTTFNSLPAADRQRAAQLLIAPRTASDADLISSGIKGGCWGRNYGTRFSLRGGYFGDGASAGLSALSLYSRRTCVSTNVGVRPAFIL